MKQFFEFLCSNCSKYFDIKLNINLNGNYRVHCPICDHIHYRVLKEGKITDNRFPDNDSNILIEDIYPMKSACRDLQKETYKENISNAEGFISRLWKEKFSFFCQ